MSTYTHHDSWLLPFLGVVRTRPGMYLGDEKVRTLATYIRGYTQAREDLGVPPFGDAESELLSEFDAWLPRRLGSGSVLIWPGYVEEVDGSDRNVHTFFRLFEEFLTGKGKSLPNPHEARSKWPAHPWPIQPLRKS